MRRTLARRISFVCLCLGSLLATPGCETLNSALAGVDRPTASIRGVSLGGLSLEGATLDFDVEVRNPYPVAMPLTTLRYDLASGGEAFLAGESALSGSVPAGGSRVVTLPAPINFASLLSSVKGVRPGQVVPYDAGLTMVVDAPGVGEIELPLRKKGELPVPAAPEVSLAGITWDELTLSKASATASFDIRNTNQFALALAGLESDVSLGGRRLAGASVDDALRLAGGQRGTVRVPLSFSPLDLGAGVLNLLRGTNADYRVNGALRGSTPYGPIELPFDRSGRVPMRGG